MVVNRDHSSKRVACDRQTDEQTNEQTNRRISPSHTAPVCTVCGRGLNKCV